MNQKKRTRAHSPFIVLVAFVTLFTLVPAANADAAEQDKNLGAELAKLRVEIEALSGAVELQRAKLLERGAAHSQQKAEMESELQRERLRQGRATSSLERHKEEVAKMGEDAGSYAPILYGAAEALRKSIQAGIPFAVEERLEAVNAIQGGAERKEMAPVKALVRLSSLYHDELKLRKESGLHRQVIMVEEEEVLSEVLRLGMMALLFRTPDGRVGLAKRNQERWDFVVLHDAKAEGQLRGLFDSFKKQVRVGYFQLPKEVLEVMR